MIKRRVEGNSPASAKKHSHRPRMGHYLAQEWGIRRGDMPVVFAGTVGREEMGKRAWTLPVSLKRGGANQESPCHCIYLRLGLANPLQGHVPHALVLKALLFLTFGK